MTAAFSVFVPIVLAFIIAFVMVLSMMFTMVLVITFLVFSRMMVHYHFAGGSMFMHYHLPHRCRFVDYHMPGRGRMMHNHLSYRLMVDNHMPDRGAMSHHGDLFIGHIAIIWVVGIFDDHRSGMAPGFAHRHFSVGKTNGYPGMAVIPGLRGQGQENQGAQPACAISCE